MSAAKVFLLLLKIKFSLTKYTVTYCLNDEKIALTSNRDERIVRPTLLPSVYQVKGIDTTKVEW